MEVCPLLRYGRGARAARENQRQRGHVPGRGAEEAPAEPPRSLALPEGPGGACVGRGCGRRPHKALCDAVSAQNFYIWFNMELFAFIFILKILH